MPDIIRHYDNQNQSIVDDTSDVLSLVYFNLLRLGLGKQYQQDVPGFETVYVVMSGNCDIEVAGEIYTDVGQRQDIWSGNADSVYVPPGAVVRVKANRA
ncbi:MAG: 5-deoxy-glucuronate isomerase, partial [Desulfobacterales bacterium]|nr:5-deoxy-glucuronate isomerase [Desulfobacterales bacterium]